ncbi:hypothetical protein MRX96_039995 [Rhipicephalus microplus]
MNECSFNACVFPFKLEARAYCGKSERAGEEDVLTTVCAAAAGLARGTGIYAGLLGYPNNPLGRRPGCGSTCARRGAGSKSGGGSRRWQHLFRWRGGPLPFADTAQRRRIDRGAERAALPFTQMSSLARRSGCFCQTLLLCAARHFVARNVPPPPPFATVAGASSLHRRSHYRPVLQTFKRVVHLTPCSLGSTAEQPAHRSARQLKRHASGARSRRQEYVVVAVQCVALHEGRMAPFIAASLSLFFPSATLRLLPTAIKGIEPAEG